MKRFLLFLLGSLPGIALPALRAAAPPRPERLVASLVALLDSDSFVERERATRSLEKLGEVPPELRAASKSSSLEVRQRARKIIVLIEKRVSRLLLKEAASLLKDGEIDQAIERLVRGGGEDPRAEGQHELHAFVGKLVKPALRELPSLGLVSIPDGADDPLIAWRNASPGDMVEMRAAFGPLVFRNKRPVPWKLVLRGAGVKVEGPGLGAITSSGEVSISDQELRETCGGFACGPVTIEDSCRGLIVICGGDVKVRGKSLKNALIVAHGNVDLPGAVQNTVVIAGGKIKPPPTPWKCILREKDHKRLALVKFFEPAKAGVEVLADKDGVKVKKTHKDKPFAGRLKPGDRVTAIGEKRVATNAEFRSHLRAALAQGTRAIAVTVSREGKTLTVHVPARP